MITVLPPFARSICVPYADDQTLPRAGFVDLAALRDDPRPLRISLHTHAFRTLTTVLVERGRADLAEQLLTLSPRRRALPLGEVLGIVDALAQAKINLPRRARAIRNIRCVLLTQVLQALEGGRQ